MSKNHDPKYLAEKQKRMKVRKDKRNKEYRRLSSEASNIGHGISAVKWGSWEDPNSPTGYSQVCSWVGTCQSPCNGDC